MEHNSIGAWLVSAFAPRLLSWLSSFRLAVPSVALYPEVYICPMGRMSSMAVVTAWQADTEDI